MLSTIFAGLDMRLEIWILVLLYSGLHGVSPQDVSTLKLVQIASPPSSARGNWSFKRMPFVMRDKLFRHGDRTPDKTYPSDEHSEEFWPQGLSQLTTLGMQQEYNLGRYFRGRYDGFLNSTYIRQEVQTRSTHADRAVMSASAVLAGLYPPYGEQIWNRDLLWQPIPVHATDYDPMLDMDVVCKEYNEMFDALQYGPEGERLLKQDWVASVMGLAGYTEYTLMNVWGLYDPLFVESLKGVAPSWLTEEMLAKLEALRLVKYNFWFGDPKMNYLKSGLLLNEISSNIRSRMDGSMDNRLKLFLYSAHDSTQGGVMFALDTWEPLSIPYGTAMIFELHQRADGSQFVKYLLKNDSVANPGGEPYPQSVLGCDIECPIAQFLKLLEPKTMVKDWEKECGNIPGWFSSGTSIAVVVGAAVCIVVLVVILAWCGFTRNSSRKMAYQQLPDTYTETA